MAEKIVIGMSGGVDSSVAAAVLQQQGYDVVGVTMRLWDDEAACCISSAADDARRVADKLGIEHHVLDLREEFSRYVIDYFTDEYIHARTPNPCIVCNKFLKFGAMLQRARLLGAELIATGHYAAVGYDEERGRYLLRRCGSSRKDQTYALYMLSQEQLSAVRMPLGLIQDKDRVRALAAELDLPTAKKPDSQEICFVPDNDYAAFIMRKTGTVPVPGDYVDAYGNVLGQHRGIIHYTIGQRKGLGIAFGRPMFVTHIDPETNRITLGEKGTEFSSCVIAERMNYIPFDKPDAPFRALGKVRYGAAPALCTVTPMGDGAEISFDEPQRAVTPGQAVVLYETDSDIVIGGGTIIQQNN